MKDNKDLRFKILQHLQDNGSSTEEVPCNKFLAAAHNDLATIRRTLKELIQKGYINESNVDWSIELDKSIIYNLNTTGATGQGNNRIERLLDPNDIGTIRLYLTLDGKRFLIESENLKHTTWMLRNDIPMKILFAFLGIIATLATQYISKHYIDTYTKEQIDSSDKKVNSDTNLKRDTLDIRPDSIGN